MGRAPCCDKANVKKGPWSAEEDAKLKEYIEKNGTGGNWIAFPQKAGLKRCGKSCRLRWLNYLRPNLKHGEFTDEEDRIIYTLYTNIGSRWSIIAAQLPGRTDNDIKNYWNTKLKKKLMAMFPPPSQRNTMMTTTMIKPASDYYPHDHQAPTFASLLHHHKPSSSPSSPSSSSSSLQHNISSYSSSTTFFSSNSSSGIDAAASSPILQPQESFLCSMQQYQASSCNPNSDGDFKDLHQFDEKMGINNYVCNSGVGEIYLQKFMEFDHVGDLDDNIIGSVDTTTNLSDYGLEEIKQLISSSTSNFLLDEIKTEENPMYFLSC